MKIFSFLTRLFPIGKLYLVVKWLKTQKGWLYPIVGVKFFSFLISFIIKTENIKFIAIIRYLYYFLSAFNVVLALIIIINFSDFTNPELIKFFLTSLELLLPIVILEGLSEYVEEFALFFKNIIKNIIDWVYSLESIETVDRSPKIPSQDQFSYKATDLELNEYGIPCLEEDTSLNWFAIILLTISIIGVSYSLHPELYHNIFSSLKDLFFPGRDDGDLGDTINPSFHEKLSVIAVKNTTDRIVNDNNLTNLQKMNRIIAISKTILHGDNNYNSQEILDRLDLLDDAIKVLDNKNTIIDVTHITSTISTGDITPTNNLLSSNSPSNLSSSTSTLTTTITNNPIPSPSNPSTTGSLTPTNNTIPLPSNSPSISSESITLLITQYLYPLTHLPI
jgi:hypothetical protein